MLKEVLSVLVSIGCSSYTSLIVITIVVVVVFVVVFTVLEVGAFERLLGPCKEVMQRNFQHYEEQLMKLFGTTLDISDNQ